MLTFEMTRGTIKTGKFLISYQNEIFQALEIFQTLEIFQAITRMNNKLVTSLYRQKTFSGVYMNYNSFLPLKYKNVLILTFLF